MSSIYVVDSEKGPYKTIQEGIEAASAGSTIQVQKGIYYENISITKDNLTLCAREASEQVVIMIAKCPNITV